MATTQPLNGCRMNKTIYELELHEWIDLDRTTNFCVYRVPGGWVYTRYHSGANQIVETFVPFNNEFEGSEINRMGAE